MPPRNQPIPEGARPSLESVLEIDTESRSSRALVVLTLSGGGTRAAAFAYGVLQELAETEVTIDGKARTLLDEVDLVSTVSGGSFTGGYLGLHGHGIFDDFEDVFLRKNVQAGLALEVLSPRYWLGLLRLDRSQRAARYYDRKIFHGATLGDLRRAETPAVVINATDLSTAGRFPFSPPVFASICSEFDSYPLADAVTASSAVPIVFETVRLRNYSDRCESIAPDFLDGTGTEARGLAGVRGQVRDQIASVRGRKYIHLLDGGVSDNLGLANAIGVFSMISDYGRALQEFGHHDVELILLISVNAETASDRPWEESNRPASMRQVVSGLSGGEISAQNRRSLRLARTLFSDVATRLSTPDRPVDFELVEVSFERVPDPEERAYLRGIETSFNLSDEKIDHLIAAARQVLRGSPELARALAGLGQPARGPERDSGSAHPAAAP